MKPSRLALFFLSLMRCGRAFRRPVEVCRQSPLPSVLEWCRREVMGDRQPGIHPPIVRVEIGTTTWKCRVTQIESPLGADLSTRWNFRENRALGLRFLNRFEWSR